MRLDIKTLRQEKKMTKNELAQRIGVSVSTLRNWEEGDNDPRLCEVTSICRALDIDPNKLFNYDSRDIIYVDSLTNDQCNLLINLVQSMKNSNANIRELQSKIQDKRQNK